MMNIRNELAVLMIKEDVKQTELAEKLGETPQSFNRKFRICDYRISYLQRLLDALSYDLEIMFKKKEREI